MILPALSIFRNCIGANFALVSDRSKPRADQLSEIVSIPVWTDNVLSSVIPSIRSEVLLTQILRCYWQGCGIREDMESTGIICLAVPEKAVSISLFRRDRRIPLEL